MTKVKVEPGACGFVTVVRVRKKDKTTYTVTFESDCEMVQKLAKELPELNFNDAFKRMTDNPVFVKGAACLRHAACPVPCGVLKALEVEAGLSVRKNAGVSFEPADDEEKDSR